MNMQNEIEQILSDMIKSIKIYQIDHDNSIFDVDYKNYLDKIMKVIENQKTDLNDQ